MAEQAMKNRTTKEHYEKFEKMAKDSGISLKHSLYPFGYTKSHLEKLYKEDENLNNIPLAKFDGHFIRTEIVNCLAYNCCLFKHLLTYEILGCEPEFIQN